MDGQTAPRGCVLFTAAAWAISRTGNKQAFLSNADAMLIPAGGCYTIDAVQAKVIVDGAKPCITIPKHCYPDRYGPTVHADVTAFTGLLDPRSVTWAEENGVVVTGDAPAGVVVLQF